ncbi:MAG TPA: hypothetical protein VF428_08295 [Casimicrobiaceae bacterium]
MMRAVEAEVERIAAPGQCLSVRADGPRPVVIASYARPRACPNLTPLLALLLERYGVPVLVHGPTGERERRGGTATWEVLRELAIAPTRSLALADDRLASGRLVYIDAALLDPTLLDPTLLDPTLLDPTQAELRSGVGACRLAALVDPFGGAGVRIVGATDGCTLASLRTHLAATAADALLLRATGGEPFADPRRPPRIECFRRGTVTVLFEARAPERPHAPLPAPGSPAAIAAWTADVLAGALPIPRAILNELACCMYAVRRDSATD